MSQRIVITGLGVISPNAIGKTAFKKAITAGKSGIRFYPELERLNFKCQVGGIPALSRSRINNFLEQSRLGPVRSTGVLYGCMAAMEAWRDAGLEPLSDAAHVQARESGCIFGTGSNGIEVTREAIHLVDTGRMEDMGQDLALQSLNSCVSTYIGKMLGLSNWVTTNSSACNTGTEALLDGFNRIRMGKAERMIVGSCESNSPYVWGPFDSLFALTRSGNQTPEQASSPLSAYASGFVPSSGAGALVIETLDAALKRGATIYAEILGGHVNSGGQRESGTMTIGNVKGMVRCIRQALDTCGVQAKQIDLIAGHLSSTIGDINEMQAWQQALGLSKRAFPLVNSMKSMIGHCLSASGSIESVAAILQLHHGFVHPSLNVKKLHPEISKIIGMSKVPAVTTPRELEIVAKISLGFGDVNACVLFKKWKR